MNLPDEVVMQLRTLLAEWNPRHRMTPQQLSFLEFPKAGSLQNLYLRTDVGVIDILSSILGIGDFAAVRSGAEDFEIDGRVYPVISLQNLIL